MSVQRSSRLAFLSGALLGTLSLCASTTLGQTGPGSLDPLSARDAFLSANPGSDVLEIEGALVRVYGNAFSSGGNAVESAERFLRDHAPMLGAEFGQLMAIGPNGDGTHVLPVSYDQGSDGYRFSLVGYTQHVNGIPVFRGDVRCLVRNEPGYPLVLVTNALKDVRAFAATFNGKAISPAKLDLRKATRLAMNQFGPGAKVSDGEQVIWAGYEDAVAESPRLAIKFIVDGTGVFDRETRQKFLYVVDAASGEILYQEDQIHFADVQVQVNGVATQGSGADICGPEASTPLPYARVTYGATTLYTGVDGSLTIPNASGANLSITSTVAGRWFTVNDVANGTVGSQTQSSTGGALGFTHNAANTAEDQRAEVNAYIHANYVRDLALSANPSFPTIGTQQNWPINVQVSGTCNAFYDGVSINFYPAGGGCANTAFSPVVHHEYGHHLVNRAGSGQGAYGEGFGDVMGVLVTDESRLAVGFQNSCATGIRDANNNCTYSATGCSSCGSAIHSCGQLLSGCVWDLRNNLAASNPSTYRTILADLAVNSVLLHAGTAINQQITIDFLTLDDDDANIGNGTPHYAEINDAFSQHGLPGPELNYLDFSFPEGVPSQIDPDGGTQFVFAVSPLVGTPGANTGKFFFRLSGATSFVQGTAAPLGNNAYRASFPALDCGSVVEFFVSAATTTGINQTSPLDAPVTLYSAPVATGATTPFDDSVETNLGWQLGAAGDTATTGQWVRVNPNGTAAQPEDDVSADGTICFVTGQGSAGGALGEADVDGGFTTLVSPAMDASAGEAYLSYWRWYSNNAGAGANQDTFRIQISGDNGATWTALETVGPTGDEASGGWYFREFRVADFVTPSAQVRVRFIADDAGAGSLVEAAVDEVVMRVIECDAGGLPGDLNGDGRVDAADLAVLLAAWGTSGPGDLNLNGTVEGADLALLLSGWTG
ncbi:MAG: hypothetical protein RI967_1292 [Planctomycetota bacterium]|jgi:Zn-dependent metalloprotease